MLALPAVRGASCVPIVFFLIEGGRQSADDVYMASVLFSVAACVLGYLTGRVRSGVAGACWRSRQFVGCFKL